MILTVSITELRNNVAQYLEKVMNGDRVVIRDEKRDKNVAQLTKATTFDKDSYENSLRKAAGIFTAERHPEWRTKTDVSNWLEKSRLADERSF